MLPLLLLVLFTAASSAQPWPRHTIDASLAGADGVRLADINGDGLPDIATGWEEGRTVRIYHHPPREQVRTLASWPFTTVGQVCAAEDAVFADLDGDGRTDVISACEDQQPTGVYVHWAPAKKRQRWQTAAIPAAPSRQRWIYTLPLKLPHLETPAIFAGGKLENGEILLLQPPARRSPRELAAWTGTHITPVGWTMSLIARDMNHDGLTDVLVSDRRGPTRGIFWLRAPTWERVEIGAPGEEVMFLDIDPSGRIAAAIAPNRISIFTPQPNGEWQRAEVPYPENAGTAKAVAWGDINLDGRLDLAFTCENAGAGKSGQPRSGVWWIESLSDGSWRHHSISGEGISNGIKFDRIELLDIDGDGDLDLLTTEERTPLGVIWYENPAKP
jgi:hypothetical protein